MLNPKHVDPAYEHSDKQLTAGTPLALPGARLKWYELNRADRPIPPQIQELARAHLASTELCFDGELGFVVLHRCGEEFYFLIVTTWRGNNELWETVFYKQDNKTSAFSVFPREGIHKPCYCVWELAAVFHEKTAWQKFLRSTRDEAAEEAYLADSCSGIA
jgi:hypothetical protein